MYKFIIGFVVYLAMSFPTFADTKLIQLEYDEAC